MDVEHWKEQNAAAMEPPPAAGPSEDLELEAFRRRLEGLL